jgi:ubiquinone/menaquinone biosynthesis C-methylase UbiE
MPELNDQKFYYSDLGGRLLGNKARESLVVEEIAGLKRGDFFLEVGCAQGHFEVFASRFSANVFGGDFEFRWLAGAKKRAPRAHFAGINAEMLPFRDNSFDLVLCTEVLEHVPDWKRAFGELQRVSRKKIVVTVPLEKGLVWKGISVFRKMGTRGHLHGLDSADLRERAGTGWKATRHEIVATPSRHINRVVGKRLGEKAGMYAMLVFEKKGQWQKRKGCLEKRQGKSQKQAKKALHKN